MRQDVGEGVRGNFRSPGKNSEGRNPSGLGTRPAQKLNSLGVALNKPGADLTVRVRPDAVVDVTRHQQCPRKTLQTHTSTQRGGLFSSRPASINASLAPTREG